MRNSEAAEILGDPDYGLTVSAEQAMLIAAEYLAVIPDGMSPEAVEWCIKIARSANDAWNVDSPDPVWSSWSSCPPAIRAEITGSVVQRERHDVT